ncbi:G-type lectin S-receptor-like serine/threonine-protein kinase LECRK3 [Euphorbia peplus]|nr:G-type lectin S-receptor-like serine/threonine-protein kinase LECRK3 [Euphorbia peplus]
MASSYGCFLLLTLLLLPCSLFAQKRGQIDVGSSLTAGVDQPWISPSEDFAFGFHQLRNKDLYLLAIWYNKIPDKTIVWYANGDIPSPTGSKVELTSDQGLVLTGPQGAAIWTSEMVMGEAAYGLMNDTGNFMVKNTADESLWQRFENPRDTLLPGQTLEKGGRILNARLRETNFSLGRFQFRLIQDGNGVLNSNNFPTGFAYDAYFLTDTVDSNVSNAGLRIVFNESGYLYVLRASNGRRLITPGAIVSADEYYHRVILHFDGVLAQYAYPKNSSGSWQVVFIEPDNICNITTEVGTGPCGFNAICRRTEDQRATCGCPLNFSLIYPNDEYGSCKPDFYPEFCYDVDDEGPNPDFEFIELKNVDWPTSSYEKYKPYNVQDCQKACLDDCLCNVIVFRDGRCWKKKLPLSNGRQVGVNRNVSSFIKARKGNFIPRNISPIPVPFEKKNQNSLVIYMELVEATNGFKEELGRGSFGIVYKGIIEITIAVKKLDRVVADSEKEFRTEVEVIGQTHHKNLVKLVGFCDEGQHRLLAYEFLSNGALSNFLFGDIKLCWEQRTQVAFGIAKGLVYLHEECSTQIIHCDIKPQNILLDENYDAKIADFGLAKLLMLDQTRTFTAIRGTKGYVAPEWFRNSPITPKVDVYSFGVLLLEIICCRRNVDSDLNKDEAILIDWPYDCYAEGTVNVLAANDEEAMDDLNKVERFFTVAIWCIQEDPNLRPTMKMVMLMLEGIVKVPVPPCPCPFSVVR